MESSVTLLALSAASTVWRYALAFFLVVAAIGLVYLLVKAGKAIGSVDKMVVDLDKEMVPLLGKVGVTVDGVNEELEKVNELTGTAVGMTQKVDGATRAVESALRTPAKKAAGFTAGVQQTVSSFVSRYRGGAVKTGGDAGGEGAWAPPPPSAPAGKSATAPSAPPEPPSEDAAAPTTPSEPDEPPLAGGEEVQP